MEEVTDWTRQTPDALEAWRERLSRLRESNAEILN